MGHVYCTLCRGTLLETSLTLKFSDTGDIDANDDTDVVIPTRDI